LAAARRPFCKLLTLPLLLLTFLPLILLLRASLLLLLLLLALLLLPHVWTAPSWQGLS